MYFSARGGGLGVIGRRGEVVGGRIVTGSVFVAGLFIESVSPCAKDGTARERTVPLRSDLNTLDGQGFQIRRRIFRIEHLAVEEGFLAARLGGRDIGCGDAEILGGFLPEVLVVDLDG